MVDKFLKRIKDTKKRKIMKNRERNLKKSKKNRKQIETEKKDTNETNKSKEKERMKEKIKQLCDNKNRNLHNKSIDSNSFILIVDKVSFVIVFSYIYESFLLMIYGRFVLRS